MEKFIFNVNDVLPSLMQVSGAVGSKNTMAILSDVVLKTCSCDGRPMLMCTASDSEVFMSVKLPLVEGEEGITIAVNAKDFVSALRNLSGRVIELKKDDSRRTVRGCYDEGYFEMPYDDADEFPDVNIGLENKIEKTVDSRVLSEALNAAECAVAVNNELHPVLNGIHFDFNDNGMEVASFDGFKMAKFASAEITNEQPFSFTLPSKACKLVASMTQKTDACVALTYGTNNVIFSKGNYSVVSRLYDGKFPPVNRLISDSYAIEVSVGKSEVLNALRSVSPSSNNKSEQIVLTFGDNSLSVSAKDVDLGKSACVRVPCEYKGEEFKIAFKCGYILPLVSSVPTGNVVFKFNGATKAAMIAPDCAQDGNEYVYILMPMLII